MLAVLRKINKRKDQLINLLRSEIDVVLAESERLIINNVIRQVLNTLDVENGIILNTPRNITKLAQLDKALMQLNEDIYGMLTGIIDKGTKELNRLNAIYYTTLLPGIGKKLDIALEKANKITAYKVGLLDGRIVKKGWLANLMSDTSVLRRLKDTALKGILTGARLGDVINDMYSLVYSDDKSEGIYTRYIKGSVYDLFQQHDAAFSNSVAEDIDLNYFVYDGGLIDDSRDFCREHNGYIYHRKDTEKWATWRPVDAVHIDEFKQKDIYAVPSYLGYAGYEPVIDRGGYNCRHFLSWITDGLAEILLEEEKNSNLLINKT